MPDIIKWVVEKPELAPTLIILVMVSTGLSIAKNLPTLIKLIKAGRGPTVITTTMMEFVDKRAEHKIGNALQVHVEPLRNKHATLQEQFELHVSQARILTERLIEHLAESKVEKENTGAFRIETKRQLEELQQEIHELAKSTNGQVVKIATQMEEVLRFVEKMDRER